MLHKQTFNEFNFKCNFIIAFAKLNSGMSHYIKIGKVERKKKRWGKLEEKINHEINAYKHVPVQQLALFSTVANLYDSNYSMTMAVHFLNQHQS